MHRINIYELMTWKRRNIRIFPYGFSISSSILSTLLIIAPSIVLLISQILKLKYEYLILLVLLNIAAHFCMVKCVRTNPGIIPQILPHRQKDQQLFQAPISRGIDQDRKYLLPNMSLNLYCKYCYECKIFRPPRSIHCSYCNHCVQRYDHHCPWISMCVGKFNYIYFIGYIASLTILSLYSCAVCAFILVDQIKAQKYFTNFIIEILVGGYTFFFSFPLLRLCIYHLVIIRRKRTTNQDLKEIYEEKIQLPYGSLYKLKRNPFFDDQTAYFMKKSYENGSRKSSNVKSSNPKEIMMSTLGRQINDSTSSSSSVVIPAHRYSITASDRTSVFNYLLQTQNM